MYRPSAFNSLAGFAPFLATAAGTYALADGALDFGFSSSAFVVYPSVFLTS